METLEGANADDLQSFHSAIERARIVESKGVQYLTRVTASFASRQNTLADLKYQYKLKRKEALTSEAYRCESRENRKDFLELATYQLVQNVAKVENKLEQLKLFREAVLKVIAAAKNARADISKKLKVVEIEYGINQIHGGAHHA